jgi:hypothetical protein
MSQKFNIPQNPDLKPAEDFFELRRRGIGFIEDMGSQWWTDYNLHDPGITILEALCYAITDLAYRTSWDIKDLLTQQNGQIDSDQSFFTARKVLTINPLTTNDFRKLLIDLAGVRNAWVACKECACEVPIEIWCDKNQIHWGYQKPAPSPTLTLLPRLQPQGLYEVLLLLEDLKDEDLPAGLQKVMSVPLKIEKQVANTVVEMLFQDWKDPEALENFTKADKLKAIAVKVKNSQKTLINDDDEFKKNWRNILYYLDIEVDINLPKKINFENVPLRIIGNDKDDFKFGDFKKEIETTDKEGLMPKYQHQLRAVAHSIEEAKTRLHAHRNLDEDFCHVSIVPTEEVVVCADIEVAPEADLERVQAEIWWKIAHYLNPPVPFYGLNQLQSENIPTEEIFNGPALEHGFIKDSDLEKSELRRDIRTSDLINLLADIEGIRAINNLLLTKYDSKGQPIRGAADSGQNPNQLSAQWTMSVSAGHQPVFNRNLSRFLFYKNGMPFLPNKTETETVFEDLKKAIEIAATPPTNEDLPIPQGTFRNPADYYPVQYSLPMLYGLSEYGLPSHASALRHAQAKQLKAYLMLFEQIFLNTHAQLAHVSELFSNVKTTNPTYFSRLITNDLIQESDKLFDNLNPTELQKLRESDDERLYRRNRFLDHLLARFGENMNEYALVMHDQNGDKISTADIIKAKSDFLKKQDTLAHDRAKAFNYPQNTGISGLENRIRKLLGFGDTPDAFFVIEHLLLRPKFPGDALFTPCPESGCDDCGPTDPYSFRLTFVMQGSGGAFDAQRDTNLELRRFAERSIRQETPSHLLPKICWVGDDGLEYDPNDCTANERFVIDNIAKILDNDSTNQANACNCAEAIFQAFYSEFKKWFAKNTHLLFDKKQIIKDLQNILTTIDVNAISCVSNFIGADTSPITKVLLSYFTDISVRGLQFERFKMAWKNWCKANAKIDWTAIHLHQDLQKLTNSCECADEILAYYGQQFYEKMSNTLHQDQIPDESLLDDIKIKTDCTNSMNTTQLNKIKQHLDQKYEGFLEVSYRLGQLIKIIENLENVYPAATLHDCADGNDDNPVRLGSTALGGS